MRIFNTANSGDSLREFAHNIFGIAFITASLITGYQYTSAQCVPYTGQLDVYPNAVNDSVLNQPITEITVSLPEDIKGDLILRTDKDGQPIQPVQLLVTRIVNNNPADGDDIEDGNAGSEENPDNDPGNETEGDNNESDSDGVNGSEDNSNEDNTPAILNLPEDGSQEIPEEGELAPEETDPGEDDSMNDNSEEDNPDEIITEQIVITLTPKKVDNRTVIFELSEPVIYGDCQLTIPAGLFEIDPDYVKVDEIDLPEETLMNLEVVGAWHKTGEEWNHPGFFTFHDDDGLDGMIPSSSPGAYTHGYFSTWYPMLESIGVRGCLSLEGRRAGFTNDRPTLNNNGKIARRLHKERGWEIMSHSMACLGEIMNNWAVDSIDSPQALHILANATYKGEHHSLTTTIFSRQTRKQYHPDPSLSKWIETTDQKHIKPFAGDFETRKTLLYNEDYNIDYHWSSWFDFASVFGLDAKTWVMHNGQASYKNLPAIVEKCPYGFVDQYPVYYNTVPVNTAVGRMLCEGQFFGEPSEMSHDNSYNYAQYEWFRSKIDEAHAKGAWIVMGGHAYRHCWDNYIPGMLVSEGGTYPDEWVNPLEGIDPLKDSLDPPARLGIESWNEWYPCPGTRLHMMRDLLIYAQELGMINVTSSEGFEIMGNKKSAGYFTSDCPIGYDRDAFEGARNRHPHYIMGANDEEYYYNRGENQEVCLSFTVVKEEILPSEPPVIEENPDDNGNLNPDDNENPNPDDNENNAPNHPEDIITGVAMITTDDATYYIHATSIDGRIIRVKRLSDLSKGFWIVDGKKIVIK